MKKFIVGLTAALVLVACAGGDSGVKSQDEIVSGLITQYFEKKALDCSLVSLQTIDTLYRLIPEDDSVFLALKSHCDEVRREMDAALDSRRDLSDTSWYNTFYEYDQARSKLLQYYDSYQGPILGYAYKCIVKSDIYELKKEVEDYIFVTDPELTRVSACPSNILQQLQQAKDNERTLLFYRGY